YLAHVAASGATCSAALLGAVCLRASTFVARWSRVRSRVLHVMNRSVPYAAAAYIVLRHTGDRGPDTSRQITFRELAAIPRELSARGWTFSRVYRSLKAPETA